MNRDCSHLTARCKPDEGPPGANEERPQRLVLATASVPNVIGRDLERQADDRHRNR
jgi:hypothetical protein